MTEFSQDDLWNQAVGNDPFAPDTVDTTGSYGDREFKPVPPGTYAITVDSDEMRRTKAGTGIYLKLCMTIVEGIHKNRKLWDHINLKNPNSQAEQIGRTQLARIGKAAGLAQMKAGDLFGKSMCVRVGVEGKYNRILAYLPYQPCGDQNVNNNPFSEPPCQMDDATQEAVDDNPFG